MSAFLYGIFLQWKLNMRDKEILVVYYIVPLVFFVFMGSVFTSVMPDAYQTLIQSMTVFGVTMGGVIGSPSPLIEVFHSNIKKSYQVGHVPLWSLIVSHFISSFIHLFMMSMIIFVLAPILFQATIPSDLLVYFLSLILTIIVSLAVGTLFGLFVKSTSQVGMVSQIIFLPSVMLSGIMFPVSMLPEFMLYIGKVIPATWCYEAMNAVSFDIRTILPIVLMIVILFGISFYKLVHIYKEK